MALNDVRKGLLEAQGYVVLILSDEMHLDWVAKDFIVETLGRPTKAIPHRWEYPRKVFLFRSANDESATRGYNFVLRFGRSECDEYLGVKR